VKWRVFPETRDYVSKKLTRGCHADARSFRRRAKKMSSNAGKTLTFEGESAARHRSAVRKNENGNPKKAGYQIMDASIRDPGSFPVREL